MTYPPEKDDTDMMLAIKLGLSRGYREFAIYGGLGGRLDHTIANIQALTYLAGEGASGILYGDSYALTVIKDSSLPFQKMLRAWFPYFPSAIPAKMYQSKD